MTMMRDEILEQAGIVARLAGDPEPYRAAAAEARAAGARFVLYAARGTSDNAAVYGKYLATILAGLPAGLAVPSAATVYGAQKSASAASWLVYVLVAATARSRPAPVASVPCAARASRLPASLVIASVWAPPSRAWATYSATSGVSPLW